MIFLHHPNTFKHFFYFYTFDFYTFKNHTFESAWVSAHCLTYKIWPNHNIIGHFILDNDRNFLFYWICFNPLLLKSCLITYFLANSFLRASQQASGLHRCFWKCYMRSLNEMDLLDKSYYAEKKTVVEHIFAQK